MWIQPQKDQSDEEFFLAGERVPPGMYKHVDSSYCLILDGEDTLPARLDGHVSCFVRVHPWGESPLTFLASDGAGASLSGSLTPAEAMTVMP